MLLPWMIFNFLCLLILTKSGCKSFFTTSFSSHSIFSDQFLVLWILIIFPLLLHQKRSWLHEAMLWRNTTSVKTDSPRFSSLSTKVTCNPRCCKKCCCISSRTCADNYKFSGIQFDYFNLKKFLMQYKLNLIHLILKWLIFLNL